MHLHECFFVFRYEKFIYRRDFCIRFSKPFQNIGMQNRALLHKVLESFELVNSTKHRVTFNTLERGLERAKKERPGEYCLAFEGGYALPVSPSVYIDEEHVSDKQHRAERAFLELRDKYLTPFMTQDEINKTKTLKSFEQYRLELEVQFKTEQAVILGRFRGLFPEFEGDTYSKATEHVSNLLHTNEELQKEYVEYNGCKAVDSILGYQIRSHARETRISDKPCKMETATYQAMESISRGGYQLLASSKQAEEMYLVYKALLGSSDGTISDKITDFIMEALSREAGVIPFSGEMTLDVKCKDTRLTTSFESMRTLNRRNWYFTIGCREAGASHLFVPRTEMDGSRMNMVVMAIEVNGDAYLAFLYLGSLFRMHFELHRVSVWHPCLANSVPAKQGRETIVKFGQTPEKLAISIALQVRTLG